MEPSPKKRRLSSKLSSDSSKLLPRDAEKSSLVAQDDWNKKELWIVQLPKDLNPTVLDGLKISPTVNYPLALSTDKMGSTPLEATVQPTDAKSSSMILLPSTKPGGLKCAVPKMFIHVQHAVTVPPVSITLPPRSETRVEPPHDLKQRYKPFGWRKPVEVTVPAPPTSVSTVHDSKKKHKRKHKKHVTYM